MDSLEGGHRRSTSTTSCFNICYAWASFLFWTTVIFLLIFGIAFFAFIKSTLPQIKVHRLNVYKLNVTEPNNNNNNRHPTLTIDVRIMVNVTNANKNMMLVYGKLNVETTIEGFSLPSVRVDGFRQNAMTSNDLKIRPREMRSAVKDDDHAKQLKVTADHREVVFSLKMKGKIQFWLKGRGMGNLHVKVLCEGVEQSQIDQAVAHACNVKLGFFG
ncbi:hypothetical protein L1987_77844 [Smallanthus sonchifolius]|uniref:Uncharacterized protein n=1 Tax=Smallanthus sonchifolius TaxID=185202 RepID=A0ACB8ZC16_9ASTR|nr:hypothetical protein L1987_77844 [Smallanthus sonchifolius]